MADIHTPIPKLRLNDGTSIPMVSSVATTTTTTHPSQKHTYRPTQYLPLTAPQLAFGTGTAWYKKGDESVLDQVCIDSAKTAIGLGYHHLDGAEVYKTETELGVAIKESGVAREKLYVVTKVLPNIADIPAALNVSLKKLGVDYVDL
jgi:diketogulonate reductase-like aldo/keto reductase